MVRFAAMERRVVVERGVAEFPRITFPAAIFRKPAEQTVVSHAGRAGRVTVETGALHIGSAFRVAKETDPLTPLLAGRRNFAYTTCF
jgi:hypothetical protein